MSSITAMFLFNGFTRYLAKFPANSDVVNLNFNGGGEAETARLLQIIANGADMRIAGLQADFPGVWEYEVVEPFGSTLAHWAATGEAKTISDMVETLTAKTRDWIARGGATPETAAESLPEGRGRLVALVARNKTGRGIHFAQHPLLSGSNFNLWIPVASDESWFVAVERILVMNGVAENVTSVTPFTEDECSDLEIIFNRRIG